MPAQHPLYGEAGHSRWPTVFSETFEYTSCAEWHPLKPENILPYDTVGALYKEYTAERDTHIRFSPRIKELAANLTAGKPILC